MLLVFLIASQKKVLMNTLIGSWQKSLALLRPHNLKMLVIEGYNSVRTSIWPLLRVFLWTFLFSMILLIVFLGALSIKNGSFFMANLEADQGPMKYFVAIISILAIWGYVAAIRPSQEKYRKGYFFHILREYKLAIVLSMLSIALMLPLAINYFIQTWLIIPLFGLGLLFMLGILDRAPTPEGLLTGLRTTCTIILHAAPVWLIWFALLFVVQMVRSTVMFTPEPNMDSQAALLLIMKGVGFASVLWLARTFVYVIGVQLYYQIRK